MLPGPDDASTSPASRRAHQTLEIMEQDALRARQQDVSNEPETPLASAKAIIDISPPGLASAD